MAALVSSVKTHFLNIYTYLTYSDLGDNLHFTLRKFKYQEKANSTMVYLVEFITNTFFFSFNDISNIS